MATKLYHNDDENVQWLFEDVVVPLRGAWGHTAFAEQQWLAPVKVSSSIGLNNHSQAVSAGTAVCHAQGISQALDGAQTIAGTLNPLLLAWEANAAFNCVLRVYAYVLVGDTSAVRGVLLDTYVDTTEFPTAGTFGAAIRFASPQTLTPVAAQEGDRLCIEWGFVYGTAVPGGSTQARLWYRADFDTGDLTAGSTDQTLNGFFEFSQTLAFKAPPANDQCAGATVVSSYPHTEVADTRAATMEYPSNMWAGCSPWQDDTFGVWWKLTNHAGEILSVHTGGAPYSNVVSLWTGSCPRPATQVACKVNPTAADPLTYTPVAGTDYYLLVQRDASMGYGPGGLLPVSISAGAAPPHGCTTAIPISSLPFTVSGLDTTALPNDETPVIPCMGGTLPKHTQWFTYTPSVSHRLYLDTNGTTYANTIGVFTGSCPSGPWTSVKCSPTGPGYSRLSMYVAAGTTYWIVVAAQDNPGGLLTLHAGDTAALGFIKPGMKGAAGLSVHQWNYAANGIDAAGFLTFLHPSGGHVLRIGMEARGSCAVGYDWITYLQGLLVTGAFQPYPGIVYPPEHFVGYGPAFIPPYHTSGDCGVGGTFHGNIERSTGATSGVVSEELYFYGQIHVRFRCGDWDEISHDILPTGYVEVKWENSDIGFEQGTGDVFRFENVALGGPSYTRPPFGPSYPPSSWEGVMWHPSQYTDRFYVRDIDEFNLTWDPSAAGLLYFKDWTATPATPADMYVEDGGVWERWYHSSVDEDEQAPSQKAIPMIDPQGRPANVDNTTNISYAFFAFRTPVEGLPPYIPPSSNSCPVDFPIEAEPAGGSCAPPFFDPDTEENWP